MLERVVQVHDQLVGAGHPPLVLADIGTYFDQNLSVGTSLIDAVADAGLSLVKGEVLHDASICLDVALEETITTRDLAVSKERYRRVIEQKVLSLTAYEKLFEHVRRRRLALALSVYDAVGLQFAIEQQAALIKIASSNVVHRPLIELAATTGKPVVMDTGATTLEEVCRAVRWFVGAGGTKLIVEYSPPGPPAPASGHNLGMLQVYRSAFGCPVGLSDHHSGDEMIYAAIGLGANVVEKGVCPRDLMKGQDVGHALPANLLADVVRKCGNVHVALNGTLSDLLSSRSRHPARMGLITKRDLQLGHQLTADDLAYAFPAVGIPVEHVEEVVGRSLVKNLPGRTPIRWADLNNAGAA